MLRRRGGRKIGDVPILVPLYRALRRERFVSGNWRMTFTFEAEDAVLVDYQDYD